MANADLLIFTKQFSAMVRSNLPLVQALDSLSKDSPRRSFRAMLADVLEQVRCGRDFDRALADYPKIFNGTYIGVVKAGMQSGQLGAALQQISEYLDSHDKVLKKVRSALIYPAMLFMSFLVTFHVMIFGILPRFQSLFSSYGKALPAPTQFILDIGAVYAEDWPFIGGGLVMGGLAFFAWVRTPAGRLTFDRLKLNLPLFGHLMRLSAMARFAKTLAIQVQNSVSLIESIRVAAPANNNKYMEWSLMQIADRIEQGENIAQAFQRQELFRGVVQQMISAGEQSGDLATPLTSVSNYFESLWVQKLESVIATVNPLLTATMGFLISSMLIAAFLPVFEVSSLAVQ
ncbi:MAG: type II secretion system F family protein [Alphaproteobacteria bacterium]|nr:type II secretion system F family protein [Alphaproteobacteria bacterium]